MNMILMVGIILTVYFILLSLMIIYHNKMTIKFWNLTFCLLIEFFLIYRYINQYQLGSFNGFITFEYISPFTFTTIPLMYIMSDKFKNYYLSMIAFLCVGMFFATMIPAQEAYLFSFKQEANLNYLLDSLCHMFTSLFGLFLILSGQVKLEIKNLIKSIILLYSVILIAVIINTIFNTNYFYMSPYGNYKIYFLHLFPTFWATLVAFLLGIFIVLLTGFEVGYGMMHLLKKDKAIEEITI